MYLKGLVVKKILLIACVFLSFQSFALDLAKYPIELSSGDGVTVVIAPTTDKKQALIKVIGINHEIDGVAFLTDFKPHGSNNAYKYTYDGTERSLVTVEEGYRCCSYTLYVPETREGIYLSAKEQPNPAIVADLKAQYESQLSKGTQAKLATFDREKHLAYQQDKMAVADSGMLEQCGVKVDTTIDWKTINDKTLQTYAVGAYCAQVANEIASMCESDDGFKSKVANINTIECEFADELKLRESKGALTFKTAPKAPNQPQFIKAYLLNL
jgi:hypothetical protein